MEDFLQIKNSESDSDSGEDEPQFDLKGKQLNQNKRKSTNVNRFKNDTVSLNKNQDGPIPVVKKHKQMVKEYREIKKRGKNAMKELDEKAKKYKRLEKVEYSDTLASGLVTEYSQRRASNVEKINRFTERSAKLAAEAEILHRLEPGMLEAEEGEETYEYNQKEIKEVVDLNTARKMFDLDLGELGPYHIDFTSNGRHLLLGGSKGHLAVIDWNSKKLITEIQARQKIHKVKFLHTFQMFAAAQKNQVHMYNQDGVEVHALKTHIAPKTLEFLPNHYLLVSGSDRKQIIWQDISTGEVVANYKAGHSVSLVGNPRNAVIYNGTPRGVVEMWVPSINKAVGTILCHNGTVNHIAFDITGNMMVTAGADTLINIWDIRMNKKMYGIKTKLPITSMDVSQRGILAASTGQEVIMYQNIFSTPETPEKVRRWKENETRTPFYDNRGSLIVAPPAPYMIHKMPDGKHGIESVQQLKFVPFEDILGIGYSKGYSSIVIPGAGEPNLDTFVANPYQTKKQRREMEVKNLLDKIPHDLIHPDPDFIGEIKDVDQAVADKKELFKKYFPTEEWAPSTTKRKHLEMKKTINKYNAKRDQWAEDQRKREREREDTETKEDPRGSQGALGRFDKKKKLL